MLRAGVIFGQHNEEFKPVIHLERRVFEGMCISASTVLPEDGTRRFGVERIPQRASGTGHRGPILPWSHDKGDRPSESQGTADLTGSALYGTLYE
jgi:hypothetical protein